MLWVMYIFLQAGVNVTEKMIFNVFGFVSPNKMTTVSIKKKMYDKDRFCSGFAFIVSLPLLLLQLIREYTIVLITFYVYFNH